MKKFCVFLSMLLLLSSAAKAGDYIDGKTVQQMINNSLINISNSIVIINGQTQTWTAASIFLGIHSNDLVWLSLNTNSLVAIINSTNDYARLSGNNNFTNRPQFQGVGLGIAGEPPLYDGVFNSPTISTNGTGNGSSGFSVGSGTFNLYTNNLFSGRLQTFSIDPTNLILSTSNSYWFLYADYNSGHPIYAITDSSGSINNSSQLLIASLYWEKTDSSDELHYLSAGESGKGSITKLQNRELTTPSFERYIGLALSSVTSTSLEFQISSGYVWYGMTLLNVSSAYSTNLSNTHLWFHTNGVWNSVNTNMVINNRFDDASNLIYAASEKYLVNWIYECMDNTRCIDIVLGSTNYDTSAAAKASLVTTPPMLIQYNSLLIGQIITKQGTNAIQDVASAFVDGFTPVPVVNHNDLGNISGQVPYIHLGQVEYNEFSGGIQKWDKASVDSVDSTNRIRVLEGQTNGYWKPGIFYSASNVVFNATASSNFYLPVVTSQVDCLRGGIYDICTNIFSKTFTLTWYESSDYKATNAYWRANVSLVSSPLASAYTIGGTTVVVADATGFLTNDLVYFQTVGTKSRIAAITNATLYFEDPLIANHSANEGVSRIAEFGGFGMWNNASEGKLYGKLSTTNTVTCTNRVEIFYKE